MSYQIVDLIESIPTTHMPLLNEIDRRIDLSFLEAIFSDYASHLSRFGLENPKCFLINVFHSTYPIKWAGEVKKNDL